MIEKAIAHSNGQSQMLTPITRYVLDHEIFLPERRTANGGVELETVQKKLESTKAIAALHHTSNNKMDESKTDWFGFHSRTHRKQASRLEKQFVRGSYAN